MGNSAGNFFTMTEYVRHASNYGSGKLTYSPPTLISQLNIISECIVYTCIFSFVKDFLKFGVKYKKLLFPCIGYILYIAACDSRGNLIRNITIIAIIIFGLLLENKTNVKKTNKKILKIGILFLLIFFVVFRILGYRTGTSYNYSWSTNIAKYVSSGIYGLDEYLLDGPIKNNLFGESTFRLIYLKLNDFGATFNVLDANDVFYQYAKGESNIYTGLKGIINDFSVFGAGVFLMIWSMLSVCAVKAMQNKKCTLMNCVVTGLLFYPIVMISISVEWRNVLSIPTIYMLFYLTLLSILIRKSERYIA